MGNKLSLISNPHRGKEQPEWIKAFDQKIADQVQIFHQQFAEYTPTPLIDLPKLARKLGISGLFVKDESRRFGLEAFKGLGGSYCLGRYLAEHPDQNGVTFVTATDGNHGRGIAWAARKLGCKAVVYMPAGSSAERLANIRAQGAEATITNMNYDDTVRFAARQAEKNGWVLVQDTAWKGYETIPSWIMQGYLTMANEAATALGNTVPSHIFLQAGVGAMSGALTAFFRNRYGFGPKIVIVEPNQADCIYRTALADDGTLHTVSGALHTIMAGLACGEPCTVGWPILRDYASAYVSCPDYVAANGMRLFAAARGGDAPIVSGESGAAPLGALDHIMRNPALAPLRESLGLGPDSRVMLISTEGDTSPRVWRDVCWYGRHGDELRVGK